MIGYTHRVCIAAQVDFMNMHVYTCSHQAVTDAILAMRRYSRPIWMTEFACVLGSSTWPPTTANNLRVQLECVPGRSDRAAPAAQSACQQRAVKQ